MDGTVLVLAKVEGISFVIGFAAFGAVQVWSIFDDSKTVARVADLSFYLLAGLAGVFLYRVFSARKK